MIFVDNYNNTHHTTIKMKPTDIKFNSYAKCNSIEYNESNEKDPKFKIGGHVKTSKYKNIFAKGYDPNWSEEVFVISKIKNADPWIYANNDLNREEIMEFFFEKESKDKSERI